MLKSPPIANLQNVTPEPFIPEYALEYLPPFLFLSKILHIAPMIERNVRLKDLKRQELDDKTQTLLQKAIEATQQAWAPYSRFHVGAAALLDNGELVSGSNQENAAYPSGLCAERTLLFHLGHTRPHQRILAMAITAHAPEYHIPEPLCPCGACLQVMAEQVKRQQHDFDIYLYSGTETVFHAQGVKQFLPFAFELRKK